MEQLARALGHLLKHSLWGSHNEPHVYILKNLHRRLYICLLLRRIQHPSINALGLCKRHLLGGLLLATSLVALGKDPVDQDTRLACR